jgi:putative aldouronate transport system substrate-binding protein
MHREASHDSPLNSRLTRRGFLTATAGAAGAVAAAPLLAACGSGGAPAKTGAASTSLLERILPKYKASNLVKPDYPSVNGSSPAYLNYPANLVRTVSEIPGAGGNYTAITPLWGTIPSAGNPFDQAVNGALGATVSVNPANGNNYATILPQLFSGNKLPDWIQVPTFWAPPLNFGQAAADRLADLTPYLAGSKINQYPNLAAIFTDGWQAGIWDDKLYGFPSYTAGFNVGYQLYYRADILDRLGIGTPKVTSINDLYDLAKEVNDPKSRRWAMGDLFGYLFQPYNYAPWMLDDKGNLITQYESDGIVEAMNWMAKAIKAGLVHPDQVAGNYGNGITEFYAGQMVIVSDGMGAWNAADAQKGQASNKSYLRASFDFFTASGSGTPQIPLEAATAWTSYLSKSLSAKQIEECLRIANYLAAPFGSVEYNLLNYGVAGVDYTQSKTGPQLTASGTKYAGSSVSTYNFLVSPNNTTYNAGYPEVTTASATWGQRNARYGYQPLFYELNVTVPNNLSSANAFTPFTQTDSIMYEVARGRSTIADYQSTLATWKRNGGDKLKTFYEGVLSQQKKLGTA